MRGDPAVEAAAVALLRGGQDPIRFLAHDGVNRTVTDLAVARASELHAEEVKAIVEAVGIAVGNRVAEVVGQVLSKLR